MEQSKTLFPYTLLLFHAVNTFRVKTLLGLFDSYIYVYVYVVYGRSRSEAGRLFFKRKCVKPTKGLLPGSITDKRRRSHKTLVVTSHSGVKTRISELSFFVFNKDLRGLMPTGRDTTSSRHLLAECSLVAGSLSPRFLVKRKKYNVTTNAYNRSSWKVFR